MLVANKRPQEYQHFRRQRDKSRAQIRRQNNLHAATYKLKLFATVFACALMAIAVISHFTQVVEVARQVELARSELQTLQEEGKHLKLEIASLNSPERLEKEAYELGMQYPGREQMIILTAGASEN